MSMLFGGMVTFQNIKKTSDAVICDHEERRRINGLLLALWGREGRICGQSCNMSQIWQINLSKNIVGIYVLFLG